MNVHRTSHLDAMRTVSGRSPVLFLLLVPLFVALGVWQLHRADDKAAWRASLQANREAPPLTLDAADTPVELMDSMLSGRRTQAWGHYISERQYLLDNQAHGSISGYWVLTPFQLDSGSIVLVNRGWIAAGADRRQVPAIAVPTERVQITGRLSRPYRPGLVLPGATPEQLSPAVARLQFVDTEYLTQELRTPLLPVVVELDAGMQMGFERQWTAPAINAERHIAYALQWFAFAGIALIIVYKARSPV